MVGHIYFYHFLTDHPWFKCEWDFLSGVPKILKYSVKLPHAINNIEMKNCLSRSNKREYSDMWSRAKFLNKLTRSVTLFNSVCFCVYINHSRGCVIFEIMKVYFNQDWGFFEQNNWIMMKILQGFLFSVVLRFHSSEWNILI